jgi:hypothetical protein
MNGSMSRVGKSNGEALLQALTRRFAPPARGRGEEVAWLSPLPRAGEGGRREALAGWGVSD